MVREALAIGRFVLAHPIGRRRPLRCLFDVARWQLTAGSEPRVVPFAGDARLLARRGETGVSGNIYVGLHEFADMAFVVHALRPGDLFGDIGANAGSYTVLAARLAQASVVAVEPVAETAERLQANVELNGIADRVELHRVAVSDRAGTVRFTIDADTVNRIAGQNDAQRPTREVPCTTLDALFGERVPAVLKIDVEGHEGPVLEGARRLLRASGLLALVVEEGSGFGLTPDSGPVHRILQEHGFAPATYDPWRRRFDPAEQPSGGHRGNVLWLRDRVELERRVREAPPILVKGLQV